MYLRFMSSLKELPSTLEKSLSEVDGKTHFALVAETYGFCRPEIVGEARYVVDGCDRECCEFALSVADAWQGKGLGTTLMHNLRAHARLAGLRKMSADTLAINKGAIALAKLFDLAVSANPWDPLLYRVTAQFE